jgi:hypothetical protein
MRLRFLVLGLTVALLGLPSAAKAIVIEVGGVKIGGYFVRDDGKKLAIRVRTTDGKEKTSEYDSGRVKILHQVDRKRLEKLNKDSPKAYRDYAEELAGKKEDPEGRDVAMRLYLIAAYLDPQQFGRSSLVGMSKLASTASEIRKCRAMAFLLDEKGDASLLRGGSAKTTQAKSGQGVDAQTAALNDFAKALQSYRTGQIRQARDMAVREGVDKIFALAPGMMDRKTFLQKCTDAQCPTCKAKGSVVCSNCNGKGLVLGLFNQVERCPTCNGAKVISCSACEGTGLILTYPDDVMRSLLKAELWAVDQLSGADPASQKGSGDLSWSSIIQSRQVNPVAPLSLETITEFDPRKCAFRNGAWVVP